MDAYKKGNILYCFDMIKVVSGEILTVCGNFNGLWYRTRLTFYPEIKANRLIGEEPYQKVSFETGYYIANCEKLLDLPGEQHFLVHQSQITKIYRASEAFSELSQQHLKQCLLFIDFLADSCNLSKDRHGLTGSGALHNILPTSDFDWIIYERNPNIVKECVLSSEWYKRELTFDPEYAHKKYRVFKGLSRKDVDNLFKDRWKYFSFLNLRISLSFVDPLIMANDFLNISELGKRHILKGVITDNIGCYHMPYIIPINCDGKDCLVLTWLFLYNGAFEKGDAVEFAGRECVVNGKEYILVESPQDYIRKLDI